MVVSGWAATWYETETSRPKGLKGTAPFPGVMAIRLAHDKVEMADFAGRCVIDFEQQLVESVVVAAIAVCVLREIQLCGQRGAFRTLDLHMDMCRAVDLARLPVWRGQEVVVLRQDDGFEPIAAIRTGELVPAQAIALVVVVRLAITVPEIQPRA